MGGGCGLNALRFAIASAWLGIFRKFKLRNFILSEISHFCENLHQRKFPAIWYHEWTLLCNKLWSFYHNTDTLVEPRVD